jgi:hypothetical protein
MPRYHYNIYDGYTAIDMVGTDLPGMDEARRFALKTARRVLDGEGDKSTAGEDWRLDVTDDAGRARFLLNFTLSGLPAVVGSLIDAQSPAR